RVSEIAQLPADIDALHVLVAAARAERDAAIVERDHALSQIDRLRHLLRQLQRAQFGRRSEKLDPEQLLLALEDIEQAIAGDEAVVQAPAPERLIKSGLPTEAMVAYVLVAKYAWHLPLYRQAQMLLAQGLDIKRAILAFWVGYAAAELKPLYLRLRELILASGKIAVDETVAPVLDPGRGRTKKGYFWAIARDDRPWGGTEP